MELLSELRSLLHGVSDPLSDDWDPIRLGLLLSSLEYENLDIVAQQKTFDAMVAVAKAEMPYQGSFRTQAEHVSRIFSQTLGFQGDTSNYYNIKNSFLNDVLLRRKGIPISLSLVYMGLARALGLKAVGISFPGHFLVRIIASEGHFDALSGREGVEDWREQWFVDVFDSCRFLTVDDCEKRLMEWTRGVVPFGPEALRVAHPVEITSRMLRNLRAIFMEKEDLARLYWVLSALIELCPLEALEARRDRGLLSGRMGRYQPAREDLRAYLSNAPAGDRKLQVERLLAFFELQKDFPN